MRSLNLSEQRCNCESGDLFKCYCNEVKENTGAKFRKRLSSCKNFIKSRSKKCSAYGNVMNVDDQEGGLVRSQSVTLTSTYTLKKDLKDLLHIPSKKHQLQCDSEDSQDSSGSKSDSSLQSSNESINSKDSKSKRPKNNSNNSNSNNNNINYRLSFTPERRDSRRDSNESIDARFEIILPS